MRSLKRGVVVVASVIVGLFVLGTIDVFDFLPNPFERSEIDRSQPTLLERLSDIAEYRAATAELQVLIDVEEDVQLLPSLIAGERVTFLAGGTVDAAIDFGDLDGDAVDVDGDAVTITLPAAAIVDVDVEPDRSYVVNRERGILDRIGGVFTDNPTGEQDLYLLAEERLLEAAGESALRARAERNTEKMLVTLLRSLGFETVTVVFEEPPATSAGVRSASVAMLDEVLTRVREEHGLGFNVKGRAVHGQSGEGAWFAIDDEGRDVVLKWFDDEGVSLRYEVLLRSLEVLRERGYPVPVYGPIVVVPGVTLSVQYLLDGITGHAVGPRLVEHVLALNELQVDVPAPVNPLSWGAFVVHSLVEGEAGWAMHEPLRMHSPRARHLLGWIEGIGHQTESHRFHADGIVHLDLHTGNMLLDDDDSLVGIVDWEGACYGDHRFDLVTFAHNLTATGNAALSLPVWDALEHTVDPHVLRAYVAHMVLRLVDWQIRHDPSDVENQLDVGEMLLGRYG